MTEYVGCQVSVEVRGGLGWYQGRVVAVSTQRQTLTLTQVIHNGRPAPLSEVTINAGDVVELKILSHPKKGDVEPTTATTTRPTPQPASVPSGATPHGHTPQALLTYPSHAQANHHNQTPQKQTQLPPTSHPQQQYTTQRAPKAQLQFPQAGHGEAAVAGYGTGAGGEAGQIRRKPRTSVGETLAHGSHHHTLPKDTSGEWQRVSQAPAAAPDYSSPRRFDPARTAGKKERQRRARNEATFGISDDDMMATDFDFESNLALFDKQAVYEEIQSHKPDVVRQTVRENYRYDENVLPSKPPPERKIIVPTSGAAEVIYANDSGVLVPSVTSELRAALLSTANQHGLTNSRQLEMIGRAATEVIMSISGCSHRLDPGSNQQQPPVVVLLCGSHLQGAAGVNTARQLESQGVQTLVVTPPSASSPPTPLLLTHELQLYGLTGRTVADPRKLPSTLDLIVDARLDHLGRAGEGGGGQAWLASTAAWASASRAPVLALDPPSDLAALSFSSPPLPARVLLCVALPLAYTPSRGKLYLLSLPIPLHTFAAVGIKYVSPFGAKLVIPLHPCE
ncbi:enhancer of mRNA-decapping protein 3-like [Eriocheir sinensis]|uniref:enhancer of mRNA-decapping protein 3-like n=1 Tax=Eriocheir sinensis TaxID=95602 RepID=UPI0021C8E209|nr:enhancer of mRNA-decapping protein 3-like [Eriocheir sinensis]